MKNDTKKKQTLKLAGSQPATQKKVVKSKTSASATASTQGTRKGAVGAKKPALARASQASTSHVHHSCASHAGDPKPTVERAAGLLKDAGLKSTKPRQALLEAMAVFQAPFSTEDLHRQVAKSRKNDLDLVTVYRSLSTFTDLGIVSRVDLGDGVVRYELASADGTHHHHFICKLCQKIEPLDFCEIQLQEDRLAQAGYKQLTHRLEFFGICPDCAS